MKNTNLFSYTLLMSHVFFWSSNAFGFFEEGTTSSYDQSSTVVAEESKKQVVVLVHGFRGGVGSSSSSNGEGPLGFSCEMGIQQLRLDENGNIIDKATVQPYMIDQNDQGIPIWLHNDGFEVWFAHYTTSPDGTPPLPEISACVADQIAQVSGNDVDGKVTMISASLGGIVSRYYLEGEALLQPYHGDVEKLFTLGSPHKGMPIDLLVQFGLVNCDVQSPMCQVTNSAMEQFNMGHARAAGVDYYLIGGNAPSSFVNDENQTIYAVLSVLGNNDALVLTRSALGKKAFLLDYQVAGITGRLETDEVHAPDRGVNSYMTPRENGSQSRAYVECIHPVLTYGTDACF